MLNPPPHLPCLFLPNQLKSILIVFILKECFVHAKNINVLLNNQFPYIIILYHKKLGNSLKMVANIVKAEAQKLGTKQGEKQAKQAQTFHDLCSTEWSASVSTDALKTLEDRKYNAPKPLSPCQVKSQSYINI